MAKIITTKRGFKVIELSRAELMARLGEYGSKGICDFCGEPTENGFYIAVINQWFCPKCYEDFLSRTPYYKEDAAVEERNFNFFKQLFDL